MREELPEGWSNTTLAALFDFKYGKGLPQEKRNSNGSIKVYGSNGIVGLHDSAVTKGPAIVIGRKGSVGEIHYSPEACWPIDTTYFIDEYFGGLAPAYWLLYLKSLRLGEQEKSSAIPGISRNDIYAISISIPPLAEQLRIAATLKRLLGRVETCRERLDKFPILLERFKQSILNVACSGRLTGEWREKHPQLEPAMRTLTRIHNDHEKHGLGHGGQAAVPTDGVHTLAPEDHPGSWSVEELKWLCKPGKPITYGILKPGPDWPGGVPYIRVADFPRNKLAVAGVRRTNPAIARDYRRSILEAGDVLLSIRGTAGRVCRVPSELAGGNITQDTARISVHPNMSAEYVELYLKSTSVQRRLDAAMKGVAVRGVNIGDVRALQIAVPPIEEQFEIVRRVRRLMSFSERIEMRLEKVTKNAKKLTQAIFAKAFRGDMVPTEAELARHEARGYEPAYELLERIAAERNGLTSKHGLKGSPAKTVPSE